MEIHEKHCLICDTDEQQPSRLLILHKTWLEILYRLDVLHEINGVHIEIVKRIKVHFRHPVSNPITYFYFTKF